MTELYKEAASILHRANVKEGSLKTLVYSSSYQNLRQLFALVSECVKYQEILKDVLSRCSKAMLDDEFIENDTNMALVLLYEILVGKGFGRVGHIRKAMRKYNKEIKSARDEVLKENTVNSIYEILEKTSSGFSGNPRYARINLIKCTVEQVIDQLSEEGWEHVGTIDNDRFADRIKSLTESQFGSDPLLQGVLIFPVNTDLHNHPLVMDGTLALQDRGSCVPACVLNPEPGQVVLDCCAAPGNKTSHMASLMKDQGRVIALDRDAKRMTTMKSLLERCGYQCVETVVQDFMTLSPTSPEVVDITHILVDPSCSGSGMMGQRMTSSDRTTNPARLETLKRFQIMILKHALRFPKVQRVVYSTCSIHQQENEEVVEEVMSNVNKYFQFVPVLPEWPDSRGIETFRNHKNFLRLSPEKHLTNGFFVACFEKRKDVKAKDESKTEEKSESVDEINVNDDCEIDCSPEDKKKKKKKSKEQDNEDDDDEIVSNIISKKEKKEAKNRLGSNEIDDVGTKKNSEEKCIDSNEYDGVKKLSKKEKRKLESVDVEIEIVDANNVLECTPVKKKKKKRKEKEASVNNEASVNDSLLSNGSEEIILVDSDTQEEEWDKKRNKKKHKKSKKKDCEEIILVDNDDIQEEEGDKKRKKKDKKNKKKNREESPAAQDVDCEMEPTKKKLKIELNLTLSEGGEEQQNDREEVMNVVTVDNDERKVKKKKRKKETAD